jgi:hypothetical protein
MMILHMAGLRNTTFACEIVQQEYNKTSSCWLLELISTKWCIYSTRVALPDFLLEQAGDVITLIRDSKTGNIIYPSCIERLLSRECVDACTFGCQETSSILASNESSSIKYSMNSQTNNVEDKKNKEIKRVSSELDYIRAGVVWMYLCMHACFLLKHSLFRCKSLRPSARAQGTPRMASRRNRNSKYNNRSTDSGFRHPPGSTAWSTGVSIHLRRIGTPRGRRIKWWQRQRLGVRHRD